MGGQAARVGEKLGAARGNKTIKTRGLLCVVVGRRALWRQFDAELVGYDVDVWRGSAKRRTLATPLNFCPQSFYLPKPPFMRFRTTVDLDTPYIVRCWS